jgi:flagellar biosynthesis/type III secretory pathway chaperone
MRHLVELLEKETDIYSAYLELALRKKKALIDNDIEILDQITDEEKSLSTRVLAIEAARTEYLRDQGFATSITLTELLPKLQPQDREQVETTANNLREVLTKCKKFNDNNMALLKQSSNYINHMIKVFSANLSGGTAATYSRTNQKQLVAGQIADMQA